MSDTSFRPYLKGAVRIHPVGKPDEILYESPNTITTSCGFLFAQLLTGNAASGTPFPLAGVWGLALGSGLPGWTATAYPSPSPTQAALNTEVIRKPLSSFQYLNSSGNPSSILTNTILFSTIINATTDGLTGISIQEMGLIGGGVAATYNSEGVLQTPASVMSGTGAVPYFDPTVGSLNSVILINYRTLPPLFFPPGISMAINWQLTT